jgi:tRNA uridine 5-carboxymethylaminomethyl modification enzyme
MISEEQYKHVVHKQTTIDLEIERLQKIYKNGISLAKVISRPDVSYREIREKYPENVSDFGEEINEQIELNLKYGGYIERQKKDVAKLEHLDLVKIPKNINYSSIKGLRAEALQKFSRFTPDHLGQASRISGITPADISILLIALQKR